MTSSAKLARSPGAVTEADLEKKLQVFGDALRAVRLKRHLTQADLAAKADLRPGYISRIERGKVDPTYQCLLQLSRGLEISVGELLTPVMLEATPRAGDEGCHVDKRRRG